MTTTPPQRTVSEPRNGFGIAALALAIVGLVFGLIPLTGFLALILGAIAVLFGLLGFGRVRKGIASNKVMSLAGTALGAVAVVLGIWGMTIVFGAVDDLASEFESLGRGSQETQQEAGGANSMTAGDRGNPIANGESARVGDWGVTFSATRLDATAAVLAENQFNDPPAAGRQFVMGEVTVAYVGDDTGLAWVDLNFRVLGSAGNTFGSGTSDYCGVYPNPISDHGELFPGATATANVCTSVPSDQLDGAVWLVEEAFSRDGRVFFAMD